MLPTLNEAGGDVRVQFGLKSLPGIVQKDATIQLDASLRLVAYEKVKQYLFQLADVSSEDPQVKVTLQWTEAPCDLATFRKILAGMKDYTFNAKVSLFGRR
jgi:hypothetical protein